MRSMLVGIMAATALTVGGSAALADGGSGGSTSPLPPTAKACDNPVPKIMNPHCNGHKPGKGKGKGGGGNPGRGGGNGNNGGGNNSNNNSQQQQQQQSQSQSQCILVLGVLSSQPTTC